MAANIFTGAINANTNNLENWSLAAIPTAGDGNVATWNALSPACTVAAALACNGADFTNYANTITFTNQITVSGDVTLGSGMAFAGAAGLLVNATATLTSNGKTCPQPLTLNGTITYTIVSTWTNSGLVTLGGTTLTTTINGGNLDFSAGFTHGGSTAIVTGTATLRAIGTGTYTNPTSSGTLRLNFVINTAGTLTISSTNFFRYSDGTLTYTAGTVVTTSTNAVFGRTSGSTTVLNTAGIQWNNIIIDRNQTVTMTSALYVGGTLDIGASGAGTVVLNGSNVDCYSSVTHSSTNTTSSGTSLLTMNATGTFTPAAASRWTRPLTIQAGAGTVTIASGSTWLFDTGTLTYVSGTVVTTNTTLSISSGTTAALATAGITWNAVTISGGLTVTLSSALTVGGLLTLGSSSATNTINGSDLIATNGFTHGSTTGTIAGTSLIRLTGSAKTYTVSGDGRITSPVSIENNTTMAGAKGFDLNTLSMPTAGKTLTLVATKTYRVRVSVTITGTSGSHVSLVSGTPSSAAFFTLNSGANQSVRHVNATDIDSSLGEMVHAFHSTLLRTVNWDHQNAPGVPRGLPSALSRLRPSPSL